MEKQQEDSPLRPLNFLIGKWRTEGEVKETSTSQPIKIKGTDTYEWVLNGSFILHRVDVMMGDIKTEVIEMIGEYNKTKNTVQMRSFDAEGGFATMQGSLSKEGLFEIDGDNMRAKLSHANNVMNAHWETFEDGKNWKAWMDLRLIRV